MDHSISHDDDRADLIAALSDDPSIRHQRRWGTRYRLRRWMNLIYMFLQFAAEGSLFRRAFFIFGMATLGLPVQWLVDRFTKGTAIVARDGRSGLDIFPTRDNNAPAWIIVRFWAWPIGQGHGRAVSAALFEAADRTNACLVLQAGNQQLAHEFYAPLGFVHQQGQEHKRRPRLVREPAMSTSTDCGRSISYQPTALVPR